ncbi:MAG: rhodanese-like domain-containing protein [Sphaerospermopsis sp.]|nr:rhodanese-like domain-containing protein [Sphaerospermopsis sp.]
MDNHVVTLASESDARELKSRLDWGQPALTIVDVRDRGHFNSSRVMGAVAIPLGDLANRASTSLHQKRDIYVYGDTDEQTHLAAAVLRNAGYNRVSELKGGLTAWKAAGGPTEGTES